MTVKLYLCNYNTTATLDLRNDPQPAKSDVEALISAKIGTTVELDCIGIYAKPVYNVEEYQYLNGYRQNNASVYLSLKPITRYVNYSEMNDDITDIYPLLNYKYMWVYVSDYKLKFHDTDNCLAVNLVSYELEHNDDVSAKRLTIELMSAFEYTGVL